MIIPKDNVKDLEDIPENAKRDLNIHAVETIDEVLTIALGNPPSFVEFVKLEPISAVKSSRRKKSISPSAVN